MRIALLCLEKGGGISHCAYELAQAMDGMAEVRCFLAAQNDMLSAFEALTCEVRAFPLRRGPRSLLQAIVTGRERSGIAPAIRSYSPDIVLDAGSGAWAEAVLKHLKGRVPIAQMVHDVYPHPDIRSRVDALPSLLQGRVADAVIGLSEFSYGELALKYPDTPRIRSRVGVLMPRAGIDTGRVAELRHKQLFVGRIHPYKGLATLVEAFAMARQANPTLELSIVGRGPIGARLLRRMRELEIHLENRYVSDAEMQEMLASHGVMILPYSSATQSGVSALALANGMPCVATSVGGLPEQVQHERNGLIVPPRDAAALARAMVAMAASEETARRMADESLRIGREEYSWVAIAQTLVDDLTRLLADRRGSRVAG